MFSYLKYGKCTEGVKPPKGEIDAGRVEEGTNAYLVPRFPKLDYIKRAVFLP